jgi:hypothetical protein
MLYFSNTASDTLEKSSDWSTFSELDELDSLSVISVLMDVIETVVNLPESEYDVALVYASVIPVATFTRSKPELNDEEDDTELSDNNVTDSLIIELIIFPES